VWGFAGLAINIALGTLADVSKNKLAGGSKVEQTAAGGGDRIAL
jgi:hypothetical protein